MKFFHFFILLLATMICGNIIAQDSQKELAQLMLQHGEYYFSLSVQQVSEIQAINKLCSVDKTDGNTVICYANQKQYENLLKQGYQPRLMTPPSLLEKAAMWDGNNRDAYDWDSYPTYEAYEAMMYQFGTDHPDKCEIITLGTLPSGRKIMIAHLNNGNGDGKPKFLYTSTIHGDETTGWIMMLRLIDYLLENPNEPEVQQVMENIDLFIGPNTNPDGTYHAGNYTVNGATRYNANGVDMNRNYPDPHGSAHPDGESYAQETQWFMQFAQDHPFVMGANYHGGAEVMNYPWDNSYTLHADDAWYQLISHEYADLTHQINSNYMTDYNNGITNGAQWYTIGGGRQDYMNAYAQCRELTIECSNTKLPNGSQLPSFWNYNKNSIFAFMNQCLYGIHGTVTDLNTGNPIEATITITGHDDEYSSVGSHLPAGDFHRPIKGGTYTLTFTANGYHPHQETVTVADRETVTLNVQLEAGEGLLPDFTANPTNVSLHGNVNFTDQTWGANLVSWEWTFEGGTPATSTSRNPSVTYDAIGDFDVTLTVTNSNGQAETVTKQNYIHVSESYNMQNGTIETCNALFYDNGGPTGNYSDQRDYTMTFLPGTPGGILEVTFQEFSLENNWDFLYIHDGTSTSAPSLGTFTGSNSPGTITATNDQGALTFHFTSDHSVSNSGWAATVYCIGITYDPIVITTSASPQTINEGESSQLMAEVTGGDGNYIFEWEPKESLNDANIANPIATPTDIETTYRVIVTDGQGASATSEITVYIRDWSADEFSHEMVKIYPNPVKGILTLEGNAEFHYEIVNSLGQRLLTGTCQGKTQISTSNLEPGVYLLNLQSEQTTTVKKLIIEK